SLQYRRSLDSRGICRLDHYNELPFRGNEQIERGTRRTELQCPGAAGEDLVGPRSVRAVQNRAVDAGCGCGSRKRAVPVKMDVFDDSLRLRDAAHDVVPRSIEQIKSSQRCVAALLGVIVSVGPRRTRDG